MTLTSLSPKGGGGSAYGSSSMLLAERKFNPSACNLQPPPTIVGFYGTRGRQQLKAGWEAARHSQHDRAGGASQRTRRNGRRRSGHSGAHHNERQRAQSAAPVQR